MEPLPFIDDRVQRIDAPLERTWLALLTTMRGSARNPPRLLAAAWGLAQATHVGHWADHVAVGDTIPGFAVAQSEPPRLLVLRGGHRFSRYELRFELESSPHARGVELHAKSSAVFPGLHGRIYRALVIGTGGHRIAVRRLLAAIARRAERTEASGGIRPVRSGAGT